MVGLVLLVVLVSYVVSGMRLRKRYDVAGKAVPVPTDSASVARGKVLATLYGCTGCHTPTLAGMTMIDGFPFARLASSNITRGQGGIASAYTDADWERAIRHGVRKDGTPLFIMPSNEFNRMNDEELGRLIAYVKSVPPVDRTPTPRVVYPLARVIHTFGAPLVPAERIDHATQRNPQPPPGATLAYGEYVAGACKFCHGADLGGQQVGGEPGAPPSPPIGRASVVARWTEAQFFETMRTGVTPEGRKLRAQYMPWPEIGQLGDDELRALHMYLKQGVTQTAAAP
ncbi:MAG TPA: cytochrome c [Gemmatimonadaceae bacterium]|nr:cytochrome c [Gemmatimonadaceae bacterium]